MAKETPFKKPVLNIEIGKKYWVRYRKMRKVDPFKSESEIVATEPEERTDQAMIATVIAQVERYRYLVRYGDKGTAWIEHWQAFVCEA